MCKIDLIRLQLQNSTPTMAKKVSLKLLLLLSAATFVLQPAFAQKAPLQTRQAWVDSVFQTLDTEEKIGQLIMVHVPSDTEEDQENLIDEIRSHRIGGAIIMKGGPRSHAAFVNKIQKSARVPMFITLDKNVGDVIDSITKFPSGLAFKAIKSDSLRSAVESEIARQTKTLGFQVITGLTMADISGFEPIDKPKSKRNHVPAFQVGNDILLDPKSISSVMRKMRRDLKKNEPLQQQLDAQVKKILGVKYDLGLANRQPINTENLVLRLNSLSSRLLQKEVVDKSITLVANLGNVLPIQSLEDRKFATLSIGKEKSNEFTHMLSKYVPFDHYSVKDPSDTASIDISKLNQYNYLIISVYKDSAALRSFYLKLKPQNKVVVHFGDPAGIGEFTGFNAAIAAYSDTPLAERAAAQMIFGAMTFDGRLPVSINDALVEGTSLTTDPVQRFSYVIPEEGGMDSKTLDQISHIVQQAIDSGATPGCHVFVAHKGKVVFDKSYGSYTYENKLPVSDDTIYDLASITKVAATLQAVMFLAEKGTIDVYKKASVYLPELRGTNKKDITIKDMLTHQSGLLPFIPMWPNTVQEKILMPYYYSMSRSNEYSLQVAPSLYAVPAIRDSAWHWVLNSKMTDRTGRTPYTYRYSDMASMMFHHMVERLVNQPMNEFLAQNFYEPLGAGTLGFNPLERFEPSRVAPTEVDTIFRKQIIHGTVHDERAAMLGGIAGHAGLFGNANDLAKIGQMLLNGGTYGGVRFFKKETVEQFTSKQYENSRRGLGWDKPTVGDYNGPTTELASAKTFGHTGFTGTCIWVDPEFDLVYVFLSNRVWPDRSNKLLNANIRPRIQEVLYKSIFNYCQFQPITRN
jgi:CubicO group peptidase (beta-lactamase class C family)